MAKRERRVLIAGGGIGGLATAIALARRGQSVAVLERSTFGDQTGAGIQLGPNATRALRALGVLEGIEPATFRPEAIKLFDAITGRCLTTMPLGAHAESRYGAPYLTLHRADLHAALLSICRELDAIEPRSGFEVSSVEDRDGTVSVTGSGGGEFHGAALIGADGLWSALRKRIAPKARLRFAGATAWRTLLPSSGLPSPFDEPIVGLWLGPKAHLVHYPVHGGKSLNVVAVTEGGSAIQGWNQSADPATLLARINRCAKEAISLVELARAWRTWSLYRLAPLRRWSAGPIALLGDAAHPVLPYLAQGAALAIEDAVTLAASFNACPDDLPEAFRRYEKLRRPRAERVQRLSRRFGRLYHLSGALRLFRNVILERRSEEKILSGFDWLYGNAGERC